MAKRNRAKKQTTNSTAQANRFISLAGIFALIAVAAAILLGVLTLFNRQNQSLDQVKQELVVANQVPESAAEQPPVTDHQAVEAEQPALDPSIAALPIEPRVGARAPDFTLASLDGSEVSLSHYQGQPVVVTFFHTL